MIPKLLKTPKVVSVYIFASLFLDLNESTCQIKKSIFISLQNLFLFLKKLNFSILHFQILWCHQMPKHKTRNIYISLNNLVSKHSLLMKFGHFMSHYKRKNFIKKVCKNCGLKTSSRLFCGCKDSIGKLNFWSKLLILNM